MKFSMRAARVAAPLVLALTSVLAFTGAHSQTYPTKPITIVSPWPAGTAADLSARILAERLGPMLKQPVIVDNRPGASQLIALNYVARAPADGYTILLAALPAVFPPTIAAKAPFKGVRDFAPVADVMNLSALLAVSSDIPASTLPEFVSYVKEKGAALSYGSAGVGSPLHLVDELFNKEAGVSVLHVPYRGGAQITQELIAKRVSYGFVMLDSTQFAENGRIKIIGLADTKRNPNHPSIPTLDEQGMKQFKAGLRHVMVAPKGTPAEVIQLLNTSINSITSSEAFAEKVKSIGVPAASVPPEKLGASIAADEDRWNALVKTANIQLE